MKVILGNVGMGKSKELFKLASEKSKKGKLVSIITCEANTKHISSKFDEEKVKDGYVLIKRIDGFTGVLEQILKYPDIKHIYIDDIAMYENDYNDERNNKDIFSSRFDVIQSIEKFTGKEITITAQTNEGELVTFNLNS